MKEIIDKLGTLKNEAAKNDEIKNEPELRVMKGIHSSLLTKFKDQLRSF